MGALINVFKSLFGGILGFLGGLVGGKKDKAVNSAAENVKPVAAKKAKKPKRGKDGFYMEADEASMEELPVASVMAVQAVAPEADVADVATKAGKKGKKEKAAVKAAPAQAKVAAMMTPEELIVAAVQPKPVDATAAAVGGTAGFATQYMVPTLTSGRRSPGPSLKMFKTMAKEIRG